MAKSLRERLFGKDNDGSIDTYAKFGTGKKVGISDAQKFLDSFVYPEIKSAIKTLERQMASGEPTARYEIYNADTLGYIHAIEHGCRTRGLLFRDESYGEWHLHEVLTTALTTAHPKYKWTPAQIGELLFEKVRQG